MVDVNTVAVEDLHSTLHSEVGNRDQNLGTEGAGTVHQGIQDHLEVVQGGKNLHSPVQADLRRTEAVLKKGTKGVLHNLESSLN